jgi:hypothetical protein
MNFINELYLDARLIYHDILDYIYSCFSIPKKCERELIMYDDDGEVWEYV